MLLSRGERKEKGGRKGQRPKSKAAERKRDQGIGKLFIAY